jgi:hypothetical protein
MSTLEDDHGTWETKMISEVKKITSDVKFEMPNHNKLIYQFVTSMLKNQRTVSVTYDTLDNDNNEEECLLELEIRTNRRIINAIY